MQSRLLTVKQCSVVGLANQSSTTMTTLPQESVALPCSGIALHEPALTVELAEHSLVASASPSRREAQLELEQDEVEDKSVTRVVLIYVSLQYRRQASQQVHVK